jgi:AcrR family transcriptional regulator
VIERELIASQQELLQKIVSKAKELFLSIGIRSITMEDVAKSLGISKKTIYSVCANKAELVHLCVKEDIISRKIEIEKIFNSNLNAVEEMMHAGIIVSQTLKKLHVSVLYDLQKYFPETWQLLYDYKFQFVREQIKNNILKGIKENHYRSDIDADLISRMYIINMDNIFNLEIFPPNQYDFVKLYKSLLEYHLHAICTPQGTETLLNINEKIKLI